MRPARLAGMTGIGVDRMGDLADAVGGADVLRLENLDTDVPPHPAAVEATRQAVADDASNSYLPFDERLGRGQRRAVPPPGFRQRAGRAAPRDRREGAPGVVCLTRVTPP
jgi:hypothetical protein